MKVLELFCGTKSFTNVAKTYGMNTLTLDFDNSFNPDLCMDIMNFETKDYYDVVWASPPCQCFSVATIGRNWNKDYTPKTEKAKTAIIVVEKTIQIINEIKPKYWFIENPRGMLRKMPQMQQFKRNTVSYCQYGDIRQKPTDIWTNCLQWKPKAICKPGSSCHQSAPRGSRTGTQGLKNAKERGVIPKNLCEEIIKEILCISKEGAK